MREVCVWTSLLTLALMLGAMLMHVHAQSTAPATAPAAPVSQEFMKGFSWGFPGVRGDFADPEAAESLKRTRALGVEWVAICFSAHIKMLDDPEIKWSDADPTMVTDDEVRTAIRNAHKAGLKVLLKPVLDVRTGQWRAEIDFKDPADWEKWWVNYKQFILHYAKIAEAEKLELFTLGGEMASTEKFEAHWRDLAKQVRGVFKNPLTYNANHGGLENVKFWDAVDLISVSAYYAVGKGADSTVEEMRASWRPLRAHMKALSEKYKKPIFFIELGMASVRGNSRRPAHWAKEDSLPYDAEEQARYYQAALEEFWAEPWFAGYFWWKWDAVTSRPEASSRNTAEEVVIGEKGFRIEGKAAEKVVREWYAKPRDKAVGGK